ncbi:MAG: response regulator [Desulfatiglans sp.]|jgi:two-component system chemotaxis sensor kinase CheA|nr:response regulator [Desulfatiglans sp.]
MDKTKFYKKFREIARERLNKLNDLFLDFEKHVTDKEQQKLISREVHSLKGEARMVGFEKTGQVLHRLEDLLGRIREEQVLFEGGVSDLVFRVLDSVEILVDFNTQGGENKLEIEGILSDLDRIMEGHGEEKNPNFTQEQPPRSSENSSPGPVGMRMDNSIRIGLDKVGRLGNMVAQVVVSQIRQKEILNAHNNIPGQKRKQERLWSRIKEDIDEHRDEIRKIMPDGFLDSLDEYGMESVMLGSECGRLFEKEKDAFLALEMITSMLKEEVLSLRLYPLTDMFAMFRRNVRDIAREQNKNIRLEIEGENTEIDRQMLEKLSEALLHLIRNAIDHGIESGDERVQKGKGEEGCLCIKAINRGDSVYIEVDDDGRGIDPKNIKELAIKKKIISQDEANELDDDECLYLIFRSGFSSSAMVTDISGRGVGLDVVSTNIEEMKGEVFIESEIGKSTRFQLKLPLTLALLKLLLVKVGKEIYSIPSQDIGACVEIMEDDVDVTGERSTFVHNQKIIPLISLRTLIRAEGDPEQVTDRLKIVIIARHGEYLGLIIDDFLFEQEMVIKELGEQLKGVRNVSCVTSLGSGDLVPVVRVSDLFDAAEKGEMTTGSTTETQEAKDGRPRILVVEDSLITREMEKQILEAAGYDVEVAEDGLVGFSKLEQKGYNLVITDIEMPRLDGFQLTRRIKESEELKETPVIILTTLANEEDKTKGLIVGADAYIVKSTFDQGNLLEIVERLI